MDPSKRLLRMSGQHSKQDELKDFESLDDMNDLAEACIATYEDVTVVVVGEDRRAFSVPSALLIKASPFFAAALRGPWVEAERKQVDLAEDCPLVFSMILDWIFFGQIKSLTWGKEKVMYSVHQFIKLYILADRLQMTPLKDAVIRLLYKRSSELETLPTAVLQDIFYQLPSDCTLQGLVGDSWTNNYFIKNNDCFTEKIETVPLMTKYMMDNLLYNTTELASWPSTWMNDTYNSAASN
ncbi:Hypothetical protein D9617_8g050690 [Elsinoe fawcettii]|nr:Hypothetical protein D9617_8g050690 [Elsinoe fawcettii]